MNKKQQIKSEIDELRQLVDKKKVQNKVLQKIINNLNESQNKNN